MTWLFTDNYVCAVELAGVAYLGIGIGFGLDIAAVARSSDATVVRVTKANQGVYKPEMRLESCLVFALFVPISFFWYGWSADNGVHWIFPIIGLMPFGFGMMGIFAPSRHTSLMYRGRTPRLLVAALTATRDLFGAFLPLAGPSMYSALGLGRGNFLLEFIALGLTPGRGWY